MSNQMEIHSPDNLGAIQSSTRTDKSGENRAKDQSGDVDLQSKHQEF